MNFLEVNTPIEIAIGMYKITLLALAILWVAFLAMEKMEDDRALKLMPTKRHALAALVGIVLWPIVALWKVIEGIYNTWCSLPDE